MIHGSAMIHSFCFFCLILNLFILKIFIIVGNLLNDDETLLTLGVNSKQIVHIEVQSVDPINAPLKLLNNSAAIPSKQNSPYKMPDVLIVKVESGKIYCMILVTS